MVEGNTRKIIGVAVIIVLAYGLLAWAGVIPNSLNILQTATDGASLDFGEADVLGVPSTVNVTNQTAQTIEITFDCEKSHVDGIVVEVETDDAVDTVIYFESDSDAWTLNDDKTTAYYTGNPLEKGDELSTLGITFEDDGSPSGTATLLFTSSTGDIEPSQIDIEIL